MSTTTLRNIAANVRRLRTKLGMTQTDLAEASGLTQPWISDIERCTTLRPGSGLSSNTIDKLADALGVTPGELISEPKG